MYLHPVAYYNLKNELHLSRRLTLWVIATANGRGPPFAGCLQFSLEAINGDMSPHAAGS